MGQQSNRQSYYPRKKNDDFYAVAVSQDNFTLVS